MKKLLIIIFVLLVVIMPPILVNISGNNLAIVSQGKFDNWLGFWGSYLGGIFGSLAVIATTYLIIQHEKELSEKTFLEKVRREEQVMLKQDQLERERLLINFELSSNAILAQKLNELQSVVLDIHNMLLKALVIKDKILKQEETKRTIEDVIRIRDEAIVKNKIMLDIALSLLQEIKYVEDIHFHLIEKIHNNFKEVTLALTVRNEEFDIRWGQKELDDCQEKFSTVWTALVETQISEKEKLINSLLEYRS